MDKFQLNIFLKGELWFTSKHPKEIGCERALKEVLGISPVQNKNLWTWIIFEIT